MQNLFRHFITSAHDILCFNKYTYKRAKKHHAHLNIFLSECSYMIADYRKPT